MKNLYKGINRRSQERRQLKDRRLSIRFELYKEPRRQTDDRRHGAAWDTPFSGR